MLPPFISDVKDKYPTFILGVIRSRMAKKSAPILPGSAVPVFKNCHGALHKIENCLGAQGDCLVPFNVC